jgi:hypothetical protein
MNTGEFKTSISQMASDLTSSRKQLHDKFAKLKSDFKELQKCIIERNEEIADLKNQKKDLISLLDQAFAIIDDPSQAKLLDDLSTVETDVKTLIGMANAGEPLAGGSHRVDGPASATPPATNGSSGEPGDQAKKWAREMLKGVGEVAGRGSNRPSRT